MKRLLTRIQRPLNAFGVHSLFGAAEAIGVMRAPGERTDDVVVHRGLSYSSTGWSAHRLDVWVPRGDAHVGARPMAMVFHGGGFTTLSKDTHWMFARALARRGLVVFNVNYRLAPEAPFPAAIEDACLATSWALEHAERYGADPSRLVLAGESAGANLAVATALATCAPRAELWARRLYERGVTPLAVVSMSGLLQVSDPGRFRRRDGALPWVVEAAIRDACEAYLPPGLEVAGGDCALADPLAMLEGGRPWSRPLPSFFAAAGSRDPILDDTRRLASALQAHGARHEVHVHAGQGHSFMAMMWRAEAQRFWARLFAFLDRELHAVNEARRRQDRCDVDLKAADDPSDSIWLQWLSPRTPGARTFAPKAISSPWSGHPPSSQHDSGQVRAVKRA